MQQYSEELVFTNSEDDLLLEGAVIRPAAGAAKNTAVIWVHGLTGRFYGPMIVRVGRVLAGLGYAFVTGNNRGHDRGITVQSRRRSSLKRNAGRPVMSELMTEGHQNFSTCSMTRSVPSK